jgi:outer membrane receptor protein involved in Fe transport
LSTDPIGVGPQISVNPSAGNRQKTTMYHAQLAGRYTFPYEVGFAANYRFQSGFPYARIVEDGAAGLNICNFECSFFSENLDQNRSDSVHLLNFRVDKSIPLGGRVKGMVMLDVYNVLNADPITNFNLVGDGFKTVIATLDPRVFQVGFRLEF